MKRVLAWVRNIFYNADRTAASALGAPPQETVSSEIGRHQSNPVDEELADVLDGIQKQHVENAVVHANALEAADNGKEQ